MPVQTAFEQRGHTAPWTSFADEGTYISDLLDEVPSITREQTGVDAAGNPLWLYHVGTGPRYVFFLAQIHGNEPSGRDALLTRIRTWATSTNAAIQEYLEQVTILVIPTGHPSSLNRRENPDGVNVNRTYLSVSTSEADAIHAVLRTYRPVIAVDIHEGRNITQQYATHLVLNPNIHERIRVLSGDLEQATREAVEGDGFTWEPYQDHNITGPEYASNMFGLRHSVGLLLESRRVEGVDSDMGDRYFSQLSAIDAIIDWHQDHIDEVDTATARSRYDATSRNTAVTLVTGTNTAGPVLDPPLPDGYFVDDESAISTAVQAFGANWAETPDGVRVLTATNPSRVLVHYLVDQASPVRQVEAARYYGPGEPLPDVPPADMPYGVSLYYRDHDSNRRAFVGSGSRMYLGWDAEPTTDADPGTLITPNDLWDFRDNGFDSDQWQSLGGGAAGWSTILDQRGHAILIRYTAANHTGDTTSRIGFRRRGQGVLVTPGDRITVELSGWTSAGARGEMLIQTRLHDVGGGYIDRTTIGTVEGNSDTFEYEIPESAGMCYMTLEFAASPEAAASAHWYVSEFSRTPAGEIPEKPEEETFIDFSSYQVGEAPEGWGQPWAQASYQVVADSSSQGGHLLRASTQSGGRHLLTVPQDLAPSGRSFTVRYRWRLRGLEAVPRFVFAADGGDGTETGFMTGPNNTLQTNSIWTYNGGDIDFDRHGTTGDVPMDTGEWMMTMAEFREGEFIASKSWPDGSSEPTTWTVEANVLTQLPGDSVGVLTWGPGEVDIDWIEVSAS